ncbi:MAG: HAMP domain-containing histidine kinase [Actinobacteria bacterium]|nr:HAMP domain-containing histidine kinase [Actinomycetota bacterium]
MSPHRVWPAVAIAALLGSVGALVVAVATGATGHELRHLGILLFSSVAVTSLLVAIAATRLQRLSLHQRLVMIVLLVTGTIFANLVVLAQQMFVSKHDARQLTVLLVYAVATGIGASAALSRSMIAAVDRLTATAREVGAGHLGARVHAEPAGPELELLAATLDQMAERLQTSIESERNADRVRRDLVTAVSHDLRTPLSGLRAMVEAVDDGIVDDTESLRTYITEMKHSVHSLDRLVDDLFELVQLDVSAIAAETRRAHLEAVVAAAVDACRGDALKKGLRVEATLGDAGQRLCSPRLTRVLQNLLQNAIRHTPADGTVRVEARVDTDRLEVIVADSGEGIPAGQLGRVFEPFWRGDAARATPGAGLGLALAKRITETLGGDIHVDSSPREGTRFAVVLPE